MLLPVPDLAGMDLAAYIIAFAEAAAAAHLNGGDRLGGVETELDHLLREDIAAEGLAAAQTGVDQGVDESRNFESLHDCRSIADPHAVEGVALFEDFLGIGGHAVAGKLFDLLAAVGESRIQCD